MTDDQRPGEPATITASPGDALIFVSNRGLQSIRVISLSEDTAPAIDNDRDRAVLRALLNLALRRLDLEDDRS